jgi:hypothetical protein
MRVVLRDLKEAVDALPLENSLPSLATQPTTNNVVMGRYVKGNPLYVRLATPGSSSLLFQDSPILFTYCIIFWDVIGFLFILLVFCIEWFIHICWPLGCLLRKTFLWWQAYKVVTVPVTLCSTSFRATLYTVLCLFNDFKNWWRENTCHFWRDKMTNPLYQTTKCTNLFLRYLHYNITLNIATCFDPQGTFIRD